MAAILAVLVAVLLHTSHPIAYDNGQTELEMVGLRPSQQACQLHELVPADAATLRLWVSTGGAAGSPLDVTVRDARTGATMRGRSPSGYRDSAVDVPVSRHAGAFTDATVCVRNTGPAPVGVRSSPPPPNTANPLGPNAFGQPAATVDGKPYGTGARMRLLWQRADRKSWLQMAPTIAQRASYARPQFFGVWTFWVVMAAIVVAALGGMFALLRSVRQ